jgi:hypothetical protein
METSLGARRKFGVASRFGSWLRSIVRKDVQADPQWDDEVRRERTGKAGEDLEDPSQPPTDAKGAAR